MADIEIIQFPFPDEANNEANNLTTEINETVEDSNNTPNAKSADLYDGLPLEYMALVDSWGIDKTIEYLNASIDLHKAMGMPESAEKIENDLKRYQRFNLEANRKLKKEKVLKTAKNTASIACGAVKKGADKTIAKADKVNAALSGFTKSRRAEIAALVQVINELPGEDELIDFISSYFLGLAGKAASKIGDKASKSSLGAKVTAKLAKRVDNSVKPLIEEILPYANEVMALYNASKGISIDNVVSIVTSLVTLQFRPYIDKYNQYVRTVNELKLVITELTLIVDALNNKAAEFHSPVKIDIPTLPNLPTLPSIPV